MKVFANALMMMPLSATLGAAKEEKTGGIRSVQHPRALQDVETKQSLLCNACDIYTLCQAIGGDECSINDLVDLACDNCGNLGINGLCDICSPCQNNNSTFCDFDNIATVGCSLCDNDNGNGNNGCNGNGNCNGHSSDDAGGFGECFSEVATVQVKGGITTSMKDLKIGDQVLTQEGMFETVYAFGHHHTTKETSFLQIHSSNADQPLEVTPGHLIFLQGKASPVPAKTIQVGDVLGSASGDKVTKIASVERKGIYAPMTNGGTVVVDGVAASSYIDLGEGLPVSHHDLIHLTLSPYRMLCNGVSSSFCDTQFYMTDSGMPFYVHYGLGLLHWLLNSNALAKTLGFAIIGLLAGACQVLEGTFGSALAPLMVFLAGAVYATFSNDKKGKAKSI